MLDIIMLEIIITFMLFISLLRPHIKSLWALDGINFFPLFSLMIFLGLFAAYGFRPECIPLFLCTLILLVYHLPSVFSTLWRLKSDNFKDRNIVITIVGILVLAGSLGISFRFLPLVSDEISMDGITQISLRDDDREYFVRIYNPLPSNDNKKQPLIILASPAANSIYFSDRICRFLAEEGFIALTFNRKGFDVPTIGSDGKRFCASMFRFIKIFSIFGKEFTLTRANSAAKSLKDERMQDIRFILSFIKQNTGENSSPLLQFDAKTLILAGFAESGAAITRLVSESGFTQNYPEAAGFIGIESPIASSSVLEEIQESMVDEDAPFRKKLMINIRNFFSRLKPKKIIGSEVTSFPQIPALYITSDNISGAAFRNSRYSSIVKLNRGSSAPTLIAAVSGANALDYAGLSSVYPIVRFLSGETKSTEAPDFYPDVAAQLIVNFSSMLVAMQNSKMDVEDTSLCIKKNIQKDIYLEMRNF